MRPIVPPCECPAGRNVYGLNLSWTFGTLRTFVSGGLEETARGLSCHEPHLKSKASLPSITSLPP